MEQPADLERVFEQGMRAREEGRRKADNPYGIHSPEHREWAAGWAATLDLDEDDDPESTRVKPGKRDTDVKSDDQDPDKGPLSG